MKHHISIFLAAAAMFIAAGRTAEAQSQGFKLGQWIEIQNSILKELNTSYVDSLPIDRIMRKGVDAMLEELDPYTIYIPEEENEDLQMMLSKTYGGIGAIIHKKKEDNVIINEPYAGSPAQKYGLQCGDEIIAIDGVPTKGLESQESSNRMKGKPGTTVIFKVKKVRSGDTLDLPVIRERIHFPDIEYAGMLDDTTGYILQSGFTENVSGEIRSKFQELKKQGMKRLVLDLRGFAENGEGDRARSVELDALARKLGESEFFSQESDVLFRALAVAGNDGVADDVDRARLLVVFSVLKAVISENVNGIAAHLVENSHTHARADHQNAVFRRKLVKCRAVALVKRRAVLGKRTVKVKGDDLDL